MGILNDAERLIENSILNDAERETLRAWVKESENDLKAMEANILDNFSKHFRVDLISAEGEMIYKVFDQGWKLGRKHESEMVPREFTKLPDSIKEKLQRHRDSKV